MNNKLFSLFILIMYVTVSFSQNELNAYKYIIVPKEYHFFKSEEEDKYRLNSLTKFLFNKYGYVAIFLDEDYPQDLLLNPCLGVLVDITNDNKMFSTRLNIELKDCSNKIIFTSREGSTREKVYEKAYQEALRDAFISFQELSYKFDPDSVLTSRTNALPMPAEAKSSDETEQEDVAIVKAAPIPVVVDEPSVEEETKVVNTEKSESKEPEASRTEPVTEVKAAPVPVPVPVATENQAKSEDGKNDNSVLKSYKNENISFFIMEQGEQLKAYVNETKDGTYKKGELIGTFVKTSMSNVYRVSWQDKEGVKKETTGYFDESGNLNIDVDRNGKIEVIIFEVER